MRLRGPLGDFLWSDDDGPVVMIAGGTGLAPMLSMLRAALPSTPRRPVTLYHGVRTRAHLYDVELLDSMQATYEGFRWRPCADDHPTSPRTAVDAFLDEHPSCRGYRGYLCGPPPMVEAGVKAFKRRRMAPSRITRERFLPDLHTATPVAGMQGAR